MVAQQALVYNETESVVRNAVYSLTEDSHCLVQHATKIGNNWDGWFSHVCWQTWLSRTPSLLRNSRIRLTWCFPLHGRWSWHGGTLTTEHGRNILANSAKFHLARERHGLNRRPGMYTEGCHGRPTCGHPTRMIPAPQSFVVI